MSSRIANRLRTRKQSTTIITRFRKSGDAGMWTWYEQGWDAMCDGDVYVYVYV